MLLYGGSKCEAVGLKDSFYVEPTVFERVNFNMTIAQEAIFEPALALMEVFTNIKTVFVKR